VPRSRRLALCHRRRRVCWYEFQAPRSTIIDQRATAVSCTATLGPNPLSRGPDADGARPAGAWNTVQPGSPHGALYHRRGAARRPRAVLWAYRKPRLPLTFSAPRGPYGAHRRTGRTGGRTAVPPHAPAHRCARLFCGCRFEASTRNSGEYPPEDGDRDSSLHCRSDFILIGPLLHKKRGTAITEFVNSRLQEGEARPRYRVGGSGGAGQAARITVTVRKESHPTHHPPLAGSRCTTCRCAKLVEIAG
jgi:hypothetical protein